MNVNLRSLLQRAKTLPHDILHRYKRMSVRGKTAFWGITFLHVLMLALVVIITPTRIGGWFNEFAMKLRSLGVGGMFICGLLVVLASHPPLFGFMGSMTLIGFTYGIWPGFLIAFIASMLGSAIAFLSIRTFFKGLVKSNDKWDAFAHVMTQKGLPLVIMIRYCPLPWAIGNGLFASVEGVKFWHFLIANLLMQPRLLIPVFIGSRLTSLASETPTHDPLRFWINLGSIALSATFSITTGMWIYKLTLQQMRSLDKGRTRGDGELAAEAMEEGALLGDYSGEDGEGDDEPLTERRGGAGTGAGTRGLRPDLPRRRTSGSSDF